VALLKTQFVLDVTLCKWFQAFRKNVIISTHSEIQRHILQDFTSQTTELFQQTKGL